MKRFIAIVVIGALFGVSTYGATAIAPLFDGEITISAGVMTNTTGEFLIGSDNERELGAREIDSFTVYNSAGTNAAVLYLIMTDGGFDTIIGTSASIGAGVGDIVYPARAIPDASTAGYVVTNYPVFYEAGVVVATTGEVSSVVAATTNSYLRSVIASTTTATSKYTPYFVRKAKVRAVQSATLGAGTYKWVLKTKQQ